MSTDVLAGIRVLDFGKHVAGPWCAALLADLGAEVIRVERPAGGDDRFIAPVAGDGSGAMYLICNRGKRSVTLQAHRADAAEIVEALLATADVVVANLPAPTRLRMGLDWDTLHARHPGMVVVTATAFGEDGPYAENIGFDGTIQAMSGAVSLSGEPGSPDSLLGAVRGLRDRQSAGNGHLGRPHGTSTHWGRAACGGVASGHRTADGQSRVGGGRGGRDAAPTHGQSGPDIGSLRRVRDARWARDGVGGGPTPIRTMVRAGRSFRAARRCAVRHRHRTGPQRAGPSEVFTAWCETRTTSAVMDELWGAGIAAGPVLRPEDVLNDPQVKASGQLVDVPYPAMARPAPIVDFPVKLSQTPGHIRGPAPTLGADTDEVLRELGFSAERIGAWRTDGLV